MGIRYGKALLDAGGPRIFIVRPCVQPSFISPAFYRQFVLPRQKRLIGALLEYGGKHHTDICANTTPSCDPMPLKPEQRSSISTAGDVAETLNSAKCVKQKLVRGNLDPATELLRGTRKRYGRLRKLIESVGKNADSYSGPVAP